MSPCQYCQDTLGHERARAVTGSNIPRSPSALFRVVSPVLKQLDTLPTWLLGLVLLVPPVLAGILLWGCRDKRRLPRVLCACSLLLAAVMALYGGVAYSVTIEVLYGGVAYSLTIHQHFTTEEGVQEELIEAFPGLRKSAADHLSLVESLHAVPLSISELVHVDR
jgi:hypothetical protein